MNSTELGFDKMEYDTTKARKLFKEHQPFVSWNYKESGAFVHDSEGNKICLTEGEMLFERVNTEGPDRRKKLLRLSQLIVENIELFCQVEYTIRKIWPADLKAYDLKLLVQNLNYWGTVQSVPKMASSHHALFMSDDAPLVFLGSVAKDISIYGTFMIYSEKQTAVVCWLFVDLCRKAGFTEDEVHLKFVNSSDIYNQTRLKNLLEEVNNGCVAVVTAKSDIDSAVDVLLETPDTFPWSPKRIFVQESVVQRLRSSLEIKAKLNPGTEVDDTISTKCSSAYACGRKTFLLEYVGEDIALRARDGKVVVEAYRTVKELLSLLAKIKPYALSVWCDSTAESLEITHNVTSNIVWINGFGDFDGPPEASQSFFCSVGYINAELFKQNMGNSDLKKFIEVSNLWTKLSTFERASKFHDLKFHDPSESVTDGSFYFVNEKYTCAGTEEPAGVLLICNNDNSVSELVTFMIKGGSIIVRENKEYSKTLLELFDYLKSVGAPIGECGIQFEESETHNGFVVFKDIEYRKKVVWTSFGTIFSN